MRPRWLLLACLGAGCGPAALDAPVADPTGTDPAGSLEPGPADLAGVWLNDACGERNYQRLLSFSADGSYAQQDLVAPCPPGAQCVWSGIVNVVGAWRLDGERVVLEPAEAVPAAPPESLAAEVPSLTLARDGDAGWTLQETDGEAVCPFRRGARRLGEPAPDDEAPLPVESRAAPARLCLAPDAENPGGRADPEPPR